MLGKDWRKKNVYDVDGQRRGWLDVRCQWVAEERCSTTRRAGPSATADTWRRWLANFEFVIFHAAASDVYRIRLWGWVDPWVGWGYRSQQHLDLTAGSIHGSGRVRSQQHLDLTDGSIHGSGRVRSQQHLDLTAGSIRGSGRVIGLSNT